MNILKETKFIMNKYNIKADKSLGQNFLIDDEVVSGIVEAADITKEDLVIEIGPGLRDINKRIARKSRKSNMHRTRQKNDTNFAR